MNQNMSEKLYGSLVVVIGSSLIYNFQASASEWLERVVAVREVSGSIPDLGEHKNLYRRGQPSDYISSFRRVVKRQRFHTLKHTIQSRKQHNIPYNHFTCWN